MSNVIKIKHGSTKPTTKDLQGYELGYYDSSLYINDEEKKKIVKIGSGSSGGGGGGGESGGSGGYANWESAEDESGYIENKPLWHERQEIRWEGTLDETKGKKYDFSVGPDTEDGYTIYQRTDWEQIYSTGENLINYGDEYSNYIVVGKRVIQEGVETEVTFPIEHYCASWFELQQLQAVEGERVVAISGALLYFPATFTIVALLRNGAVLPLLIFIPTDGIFAGEGKRGAYVVYDENFYCAELVFNNIAFGEKYQGYFESLNNPIHVLTINSEEEASTLNFSLFKPGSVVLITANQS